MLLFVLTEEQVCTYEILVEIIRISIRYYEFRPFNALIWFDGGMTK